MIANSDYYVTHLECSLKGDRYKAGELHNLSNANKPLLVRYDLDRIADSVTKAQLAAPPEAMWRYREFLPIRRNENIVSLGEVRTPLVECRELSRRLGARRLIIKDEGRLPTGSFKARGLCIAVSMARELGVRRLAMPTNGNAGAAMAAYAARAGIEAFVFCPDDTPAVNVGEIAAQGAHVWLVNGLITDCGRIVGEGKQAMGWFDVSTLKEPYRIEGKKTMGLELADQLGWTLPDVIFYPTGGGTGLIGMWKAFDELGRIGWIDEKRPRMVAVQASGCARSCARSTRDSTTRRCGRTPTPWPPGFVFRRQSAIFSCCAIRESNGFAIAVDDDAILKARDEIASAEGLLTCPEGAATYAAYKSALASGRVLADESAVLFNCAMGVKYPLPPVTKHLDCHSPIDYERLDAR